LQEHIASIFNPEYHTLHVHHCEKLRLQHYSPLSKEQTLIHELHIIPSHATAQAVSHRLPTVAAQVQAQVMSCGICCRQSGTGAGFLHSGFPCQFSFHQLLHIHCHL
jgi:hypothetical protein